MKCERPVWLYYLRRYSGAERKASYPCITMTQSLSGGTVVVLIASFFHNVAFNAGTFYLALYYQVRAL